MAPEETDTAMPKISSASGISSTRSSFPVTSVHASVPCRLPIPSFVKNWLPKTTSPPPGRAVTPSISVHGVVKTCVPAHARGVAAGGGGAGVTVLSGGAGGGVVASGGAGVLSGGAVGVDCGALVEGAVPPVGDAAGVAGAGVVAADETAVPPPPGSLPRPHPSRIVQVTTAARTRMFPSPPAHLAGNSGSVPMLGVNGVRVCVLKLRAACIARLHQERQVSDVTNVASAAANPRSRAWRPAQRPHARDTSLRFAPGSLRGARLSPSL